MENQNDVFETLQNLIKMTEAMLHLVSDAIQVTYQIVEKNNGVKLNALTLIDKDNPSLSPTIYIDQAINRINEGKSDIETEAKRIVNIYKEKMTMLPGFSSIKDFFKPENFFVTVVNKKLNKNRLNEITHTNTKDLTIELRCRVGEDASFAVPVSALTDLKMTRSNALDIGISNSIAYGCDIVPMSTMITNLWDPNPDQELDQDVLDEAIHSTPVDMYVVKSKDALVGAASVYIDPAIRKKISEVMSQRHNGDYYILPSSKYEVIVIPADEAPPQKELLQMVSEINSTVLDPQDVLSDRIYLVTHDTLAIKAIRAASIKEDNDLIQSKTAKPVLAM